MLAENFAHFVLSPLATKKMKLKEKENLKFGIIFKNLNFRSSVVTQLIDKLGTRRPISKTSTKTKIWFSRNKFTILITS